MAVSVEREETKHPRAEGGVESEQHSCECPNGHVGPPWKKESTRFVRGSVVSSMNRGPASENGPPAEWSVEDAAVEKVE